MSQDNNFGDITNNHIEGHDLPYETSVCQECGKDFRTNHPDSTPDYCASCCGENPYLIALDLKH